MRPPRFDTQHYISSFDDHEFLPGTLNIESRVDEKTIENLKARGHKVKVQTTVRHAQRAHSDRLQRDARGVSSGGRGSAVSRQDIALCLVSLDESKHKLEKRMTTTPTLFRIILQVPDLDQAEEFYGKLLGDRGRRIPYASRHYIDAGPVIIALVDPAIDRRAAETTARLHLLFRRQS